MKIVFVTEINPFPPFGGAEIRVFNLLQALQSFASLHFVYLDTGGYSTVDFKDGISDGLNIASFTSIPKVKTRGSGLMERFFIRKDVFASLKNINDVIEPDIVWFSYSYLAHYGNAFPESKIVFDTHNIQSEIDRQLSEHSNNLVSALYAKLVWGASVFHEKRYFPEVDLLNAVSQPDLEDYQEYIKPKKLKLLPNFIDLNAYTLATPALDLSEGKKIVFSGSMDAFQNQKAGEFLLQEIWPAVVDAIPDCELYIVGNNPPQIWSTYFDKGVKVTGRVPSVLAFLQAAEVAVIPVLHGSGTRFKILEAMACHVPIVSTSLGCQGIEVTNGTDILIEDQPQRFAQKVIELLRSPEKGRSMVQNAYQLLARQYSLTANQVNLHKWCNELMTPTS